MPRDPQDPIESGLALLLQLASEHDALRLTAVPGAVVVDGPGETTRLLVDGTAGDPGALGALSEGFQRLPDGGTLRVLGDALVLTWPPKYGDGMDGLVRDGWLSDLASRTLQAALALRRNLLVVGSWSTAVQMIAALVGDALRPALIADAGEVVPSGWMRFDEVGQAQAFGADRVATWSHDPHRLVTTMSRATAVVGYLGANRLEQGLLRFEAAVELAHGDVTAPLQLLGAVDLVVCVEQSQRGPRVSEIVEIQIADEGYRPHHLFGRGIGAVPDALVPVGAPSFVDAIARLGDTLLADELRHATGTAVTTRRAVAVPEPEAANDLPPEPTRRSARQRSVTAAPRVARPPVDGPEPGWELERMAAQGGVTEDGLAGPAATTQGAEDAAMAAAFGLGPPPRPAGVTVRADPSASFEDALRRAQERDEELRRAEEDAESPT